MPVLERFMVQAYHFDSDGELMAEEAVKTASPEDAKSYAEALKERKAGVIAYSWKGDLTTGERGLITILQSFGKIPLVAQQILDLQ